MNVPFIRRLSAEIQPSRSGWQRSIQPIPVNLQKKICIVWDAILICLLRKCAGTVRSEYAAERQSDDMQKFLEIQQAAEILLEYQRICDRMIIGNWTNGQNLLKSQMGLLNMNLKNKPIF